MLEALAAAVVTVLLSTGSASALAAARRSSETRDAVLKLSGKFEALDARMASHVSDSRAVHQVLNSRIDRLDQRVSALEAGHIDRRHPPERA